MTRDVFTFGFIGGQGQRACMEHPELVRSRLEGERVVAQVALGGGDAVLVTPTRTLVYRAEGLLSDESVSAYPHDVERVELRSGRRKSTFRLAYVDGVKDFSVPSGSTHEVLVPVLAGVLRTAGVVGADEAVRGAYRFSELTLVVADERVVKHVGGAVWDEEFDVAPYADLTGLAFEEGSVATEISIEIDGYPQRVKVPNEHAGTVRRTIQEAVFEFHGVSSLAELEATVAVEEDEEDGEGGEDDVLEESGFTKLLGDEDEAEAGTDGSRAGADADARTDDGSEASTESGTDPFGRDDGGSGTILDPVSGETRPQGASRKGEQRGTGGPSDRASGQSPRRDGEAASGRGAERPASSETAGATGTADGTETANATDATTDGSEPAGPTAGSAGEVPPEVAERLEELTAAVERQNDRLEHQEELIQQLVEELRRGR
jgi:hypothetical protein